MKIKKNNIDLLLEKQSKLLIQKQRIEDRKNRKNETIELKIEKLNDKSFINKVNADETIEKIDIELNHIYNLLNAEKMKYHNIKVDNFKNLAQKNRVKTERIKDGNK